MSATGGWGKRIAALALFLFILFMGYFWPFQIGLDDVRPYLPQPVDAQVQSVVDRIPPDKAGDLRVPLPEVKYECDFYFEPVSGEGEFNATRWILNNTAEHDKFVADVYGAELIMGMTARVSTVGGDWANAPDPESMMYHTFYIYTTDNASYASELCKLEKAGYVFLPDRDLFYGGWLLEKDVNSTKFLDTRYFRVAFVEDNVTIYRVL